MIDLNYLRGYFPPYIANNANYQKHILKEYVELIALQWLSNSRYAEKLVFIGGTNLRLVQGIDRFSEDLDFDCKNLTEEDFYSLTDDLARHLALQGMEVEIKDKKSEHLMAYRRNLYFPQLLFNLGITGHREERFLMKIEAQDQQVEYPIEIASVGRMGFFFPIAVPNISTLLSMKIAALLVRQKGRDFYDTIFLLQRTDPDYNFLQQKCGINNLQDLYKQVSATIEKTDMRLKQRDFEHLLFDPDKSQQILHFMDFFKSKYSL